MRDINEKRYSRLAVQEVNSLARKNPARLVETSEAYYNHQVSAAATMIRHNPEYRFVLLCGPSASGKTTTAHKLKHRLIRQGVGAQVVSMDNFYRGMEQYVKLPDGRPDMESVSTLDMDLLNACFEQLLREGRARFPVFDFARQERRFGAHDIVLGDNDVLIMEGIHALNPMVLCGIPHSNVMRIYVSVRTKFVNGDETVLVPKDIRLIRRMVRDMKFRSYPPEHTLDYWTHVTASERINIDPYRDDVNLKMDNTIDYEVCVWHALLHRELQKADVQGYERFPQLARVFEALRRFHPLDPALIPRSSLLREFIGK